MKYILALITVFTLSNNVIIAQGIDVKNITNKIQISDLGNKNLKINKLSSELWYLINNQSKKIDTSNINRIATNALTNQNNFKNKNYINCFIQMNDLSHIDELKQLGVIFNESNPSYTAGCRIPLNQIESISKYNFIINIENSKLEKQNDYYSRIQSKTDSVYSGFQLPSNFFGRNVIIGIIDGGFDYTHPNFYDSTGKIYRIKRIWNQTDSNGKAPLNFTYGSEYITKDEILLKKTDDSTNLHGTHVTGLASGSGYGLTNIFKGISSESEICLVTTKFKSDNTLDAIKYLINYAKTQNKPISINLSLGSSSGSRDGTSIFNRTIDSLVDDGNSKGVIVTFSAGNEGDGIIHNNVILNSITKDTIKFALIKGYNPLLPNEVKKFGLNNSLSVEIWGDINKELFVHSGLFNLKTNKFESSFNTFLNISKSGSYVDTSFLYKGFKIPILLINGNISPYTKKPNTTLYIGGLEYQSIYNLDTNLVIAVVYYSLDNNIHSWITSPSEYGVNSPSFLNYLPNNSLFSNGDNNYTIDDESTGKSIISVGAFSSYLGNQILSNSTDTLNKIASFSSIGISTDGRIKPDISASGNKVVSSLNSWKKLTINESSNIYQPTYVTFNNKQYPYGLNRGTSMAAPVVTGVIGLWLEAYPKLTLNQIKDIFKNASIKDKFTGPTPNKYYGYGKIDAYNGIKYLLNQIPSKPLLTLQKDTNICQNESLSIKTNNLYKSYKWFKNGQVIATTQSLNITSSGYYSIEVEANNGYFSKIIDSIKVTINPIPATPTIQRENNYLVASGSGSFQWYKDGILLNDSTFQKIKPMSAGLYTVKNISNNCQSQISQSYYYVNTVTDVINISSTEFIKIVPNPFKDFLIVNFKINGYNKINIDIFEISTGRLMKKVTDIESGEKINLGELSSSSYLVKVFSRDFKFNYQFKTVKL